MDDRITEVGQFDPRKNESVVSARGLVLAPGFIDSHNHFDDEEADGFDKDTLAPSQLSQGITTIILGQDGQSPWPMGQYLRKRRENPGALNLQVLIGHGWVVRRQVMGDDFRREAHPGEIARMEVLVGQAMREGTVGLSTNLASGVGQYSTTEEVVRLARVAAKHGGIYVSHIRNYRAQTFEALREAITIGEQARIPVQISHIQLGSVGMWGRANEAIKLIEDARNRGLDVTADCYPYNDWRFRNGIPALQAGTVLEEQAAAENILRARGGAAAITVLASDAHPEYRSRTLEEIARLKSITPIELVIQIMRDGGAGISGMILKEEDVRAFYQQPWVMVSSDGGYKGVPRTAGSFPKVLGRYVREQKWLSLTEAIRKMTALPAWRFKLNDRGQIRAGMRADLVLFNPDNVIDRATFADPDRLSEGIEKVFVNGMLVWNESKPTGARPGRVLRH